MRQHVASKAKPGHSTLYTPQQLILYKRLTRSKFSEVTVFLGAQLRERKRRKHWNPNVNPKRSLKLTTESVYLVPTAIYIE